VFREPALRYGSLQVTGYVLKVSVRGVKDAACESPYVMGVIGELFLSATPQPKSGRKAATLTTFKKYWSSLAIAASSSCDERESIESVDEDSV
jgi:hypothetical protein